MKLDRNTNPSGRGKYALIKLRIDRPAEWAGGEIFQINKEAVDFGDTPNTDFFIIRLKDKFAGPALMGYAKAITEFLAGLPEADPLRGSLVEYHHEIIHLAEQAQKSPHQIIPD